MGHDLRKCRQCGWMYFEVDQKWVDKQGESDYDYSKCTRCGSSKFGIPTLEDRWDSEALGHTIQPILRQED